MNRFAVMPCKTPKMGLVISDQYYDVWDNRRSLFVGTPTRFLSDAEKEMKRIARSQGGVRKI